MLLGLWVKVKCTARAVCPWAAGWWCTQGTDCRQLGGPIKRLWNHAHSAVQLNHAHSAVPGVSWLHEYGMVRGAFEPEHIFDELVLQPDRYSSFQVIIVYYLGLFSKKRGAELVQALQGLPQKPLVVLVEHCILEMFDDRCQSHGFPGKDDVGCFSGEGKAQWLKEQSLFLQFAERWDMPLVSACNAFRWLLQPACGEAAQVSNNDNVTALKKRLFGQGGSDPFHYNAQGTAVVGCLIADAVLSAARLPVPSPILTAQQQIQSSRKAEPRRKLACMDDVHSRSHPGPLFQSRVDSSARREGAVQSLARRGERRRRGALQDQAAACALQPRARVLYAL